MLERAGRAGKCLFSDGCDSSSEIKHLKYSFTVCYKMSVLGVSAISDLPTGKCRGDSLMAEILHNSYPFSLLPDKYLSLKFLHVHSSGLHKLPATCWLWVLLPVKLGIKYTKADHKTSLILLCSCDRQLISDVVCVKRKILHWREYFLFCIVYVFLANWK